MKELPFVAILKLLPELTTRDLRRLVNETTMRLHAKAIEEFMDIKNLGKLYDLVKDDLTT